MSSAPGPRPFAGPSGAVWTPTAEHLTRARVTRFVQRLGVTGIPELHDRAVADPEWYWRHVVEDLDIRFSQPFSRVLDRSEGKPFPRWFDQGKINAAANCTDRNLEYGIGAKAAIVWEDEAGTNATVSYQQLHDDSVSFARFLRSRGIGAGDCVGLFLPMCPEAAAALLGCARVGAIAVPAFSGYGPDAIAVRMQACEAKLLVTADHSVRKGAPVPMFATARRAIDDCPTVQTVVVVCRDGILTKDAIPARDLTWQDALGEGSRSDADGSAEPLDPNHPLLIIYTSGTTGEPKGIVHSHGGFLAKVGHDFGYCLDVQDDDTFFWISDLGWVVGPLLIIGGLFLRCTTVYYEGVPNHPDPDRMWQLVDKHRITVIGISPTAVRGMMEAGEHWVRRHDLSSLRSFATAGEPWTPEAWHWLFEVVGRGQLPILNYSGGTEISGGILTCYPVLPIKPCGFSGPVLGMAAAAVDPNGYDVRGEVAELVVREPWPGMTHGLWRDRQRYLETYWSQIDGVWTHGDLVMIDDDGYWYIRGRSDDTIMVAGRRVGPAEVEAAIIAHPEVADAAAIGAPDPLKGEVIAAFVIPTEGTVLDHRLESEIRSMVGERIGRSLVPEQLVSVAGFPKTRSGKIMRRLIRARYLGNPTGDLSGLEDVNTIQLIPERTP